MVQQLYNDLEKLKAEIRRLRGELNAIATGGRIIPNAIPGGGSQLPLPIEGAILFGTGVPEWARLAPPASGDDYALKYLDGDSAPSWQLDAGAGDDMFIINMAAAL